jgi:hypothetical protein
MTNKLSPVEVLNACQDGDIVYVEWPDGSDTIAAARAHTLRETRQSEEEPIHYSATSLLPIGSYEPSLQEAKSR